MSVRWVGGRQNVAWLFSNRLSWSQTAAPWSRAAFLNSRHVLLPHLLLFRHFCPNCVLFDKKCGKFFFNKMMKYCEPLSILFYAPNTIYYINLTKMISIRQYLVKYCTVPRISEYTLYSLLLVECISLFSKHGR